MLAWGGIEQGVCRVSRMPAGVENLKKGDLFLYTLSRLVRIFKEHSSCARGAKVYGGRTTMRD